MLVPPVAPSGQNWSQHPSTADIPHFAQTRTDLTDQTEGLLQAMCACFIERHRTARHVFAWEQEVGWAVSLPASDAVRPDTRFVKWHHREVFGSLVGVVGAPGLHSG